MNQDALKLTAYFGERDRVPGAFLADAFIDIYSRHELKTSLVLRGAEGFGIKHHLRTDRLLSLSEDLPLVSVAVDTRERIERALTEVARLRFDGLVTLERARLLSAPIDADPPPWEQTKVTVYLGRHLRIGGRPGYEAVVALLREAGIAGASVLLGVDGTAWGVRQRARFFGRNPDVPLMVIAVGDSDRIAAALPRLSDLLPQPLITLERITVCRRDGMALAEPPQLAETDPSGLSVWQKLMVYTSEQTRSDGRPHQRSDGQPLHQRLVRELRRAGAAGATCLRGIWGYHGDHEPHGDSFWELRRRVPVVTVIVDTPVRIRRWFEIAATLTAQTGLITSEMVPAFRATGPDLERGGLRLAPRRP